MPAREEQFMWRCFHLAGLGAQKTRPNPMVGAVIVYNDKIIGEGFHQEYGEAHAEVNALNSVQMADLDKVTSSTMYVSLEPCCHHGKTPPCTERIIAAGIRNIVISVEDPNPVVQGRGIKALREAGLHVQTGLLEDEGRRLIRAFTRFVQGKRPYVILKFAQSKDGFMGQEGMQVWLSNAYSDIPSHKLRGSVDGILVGTRTAIIDDPRLNTRHYFGPDPLRIVIDKDLKIPAGSNLRTSGQPTLVVTQLEPPGDWGAGVEFLQLPFDDRLVPELLTALHARSLQKIIVEGGAITLRGFLQEGLWDEAWIYHCPIKLGTGIKAPMIKGFSLGEYQLCDDRLQLISRLSTNGIPKKSGEKIKR